MTAKFINRSFEAKLLNEIYGTEFFDIENSSEKYDQIFNQFVLFSHIEKEKLSEMHPHIQETIKLANFITNPQNFSCYDKILELQQKLLQEKEIQKKFIKEFTFIDVIIFSALHNCKLWSKLFKFPGVKKPKDPKNNEEAQHKVEGNKNPLATLLVWFKNFENSFSEIIKYRFNPSILGPKHKKQQEKASKLKKRHPEFIAAVKNKETEKVLNFLKNGIDLQVVDAADGSSAAHIACLNGDLVMCKILDEYNVDWEAENLESVTPIFNALESANMELIVFLKEKKVNFEHLDFQGRTPFYHACCFGNMKIIEYLYYECHCNPNVKSNKNRTALSKSCFLGLHEVVNFLLSLPKQDFPLVDAIDDKGRTALHNAAWGPAGGKEGKVLKKKLVNDSPESAKLLVAHGASVNFPDFDGNTPFIVAAASEALGTMKVLYENGADVNFKNKKGETALYIASKYGHLKSIIPILENMGGDLSVFTDEGVSVMGCCLINDHYDIFDFIKEKEKKIFDKDKYQKDFSYLLYNKKENLNKCLSIFLEYMKNEKIQLFFKEEYINLMLSLDKESFLVLLQYFNADISIEQKEKIFYQLVEKNKINFYYILKQLDQKFFINFTLDSENMVKLIKCNGISAEFMEIIVLEINFDVFNAPNFINFVIDNHYISILITLFKAFSSPSCEKIENKYLKEHIYLEKDLQDVVVIEFLLRRDSNTEMNSFEYAKFKKAFDIEKILKDFVGSLKNNQEAVVENYHIPYKIIDFSPEDSNKFHSKKEFLEEINAKFQEKENENEKKLQLPVQYDLKNISEKEISYFQKILKNPLDFHKKPSFSYIKGEEDLRKMSDEIKSFSVLGIDLEYHTTNSNEFQSEEFQESYEQMKIASSNLKSSGFVCTLQISTIEKDYIVDSIYLRQEITKYLKEIFEDFSKIKIFHGCDLDLQWLKTDFNIEVMNLFDTGRAFMVINSDKNAISLAKLAKVYLNFELDKSFQKSFWAIRPLPKIMLDYARMDSGILLGIFPFLLDELNSKNLGNIMAICCNKMCWEKLEKNKIKKTNFVVLK